MLDKDPARRPTAAEVADLLRRPDAQPSPPRPAVDDPRFGEQTGLRPAAASAEVAPPGPAGGAAAEATTLRPGITPPPTASGGRSRRLLVASAACGGALLLGSAGFWFLHNSGTGTRADRAADASTPATLAASTGPGSPSSAAASVPGASPAIRLEDPVDGQTTVSLTWDGPAGWNYAVIVAAQTGDRSTQLAGQRTASEVAVQPGTPYCFVVQGTDGSTVTESAPVGIRGAVCHT
jgi:hypothetical protein